LIWHHILVYSASFRLPLVSALSTGTTILSKLLNNTQDIEINKIKSLLLKSRLKITPHITEMTTLYVL